MDGPPNQDFPQIQSAMKPPEQTTDQMNLMTMVKMVEQTMKLLKTMMNQVIMN